MCVCVSVCVCACMHVGGRGVDWEGWNYGYVVMILFFVYCCFSYGICTLYFWGIHTVLVVCITFVSMLPSTFFLT